MNKLFSRIKYTALSLLIALLSSVVFAAPVGKTWTNADMAACNNGTIESRCLVVNGETVLPSGWVAGAISAFVPAGALWVATTGSDTNPCTQAAPCLTIGYGISQLASGGTLVVKDGVYGGLANLINTNVNAIPSGTAGNYTTIMAENPMGVRINKGADDLTYVQNLVRVTGQYIKVDGFILDLVDDPTPPEVATILGSYNKITRTIVRREGAADQYATWITLGGSYNLAEDVAGVGNARYGFYTGSSNSAVHHNIFRRAVGRVDYTESTQPKSVFAMYGNNSGTSAEFHLFQNCIAIDSHQGVSSPQATYGGFYFPKNAKDVTIQGSISLNNDVFYAGYFLKELQGQSITMEHSVAWGNYNGAGGAAGVRFGSSNGPLTLDYITVGDQQDAFYNNSSGTQSLTNSLIYYDVSETNSDTWTTKTNNDIQNYTASNPLLPLTDILTPPDNTRGADVTKQYGVSGSLWGETGYDQRTNVDLWPWPYEDEIKTVFAESNQAPVGVTPASNTAARGFAAAGNDAWGQPLTLTRYIWQYLGNQIPASIYGGQ